jgi:poly-gamma-glutamate synthesis protein (capsule biosynthesis protein)
MSSRLFCFIAAALFGMYAQAETVRLVFAGDLMLDDGPGRTIAAGGDPLAPFAAILQDADYRVGNLECPIAGPQTGKALENKIYTFRADPKVVSRLQGRFDAVAVANNHSGDYGRDAFMETLSHLDEGGIAHFGGGHDLNEAHQPLWIERKGLRIALLGYNEFKPRLFEAGANWPGVAWSEDSYVVSDIRAARAAGADIVIPFMHWGWENEPHPTLRQRQLARLMIDAGADAVVGGHPHVTQGADIYKGKPIIWSLGNFVFDGFNEGPQRQGWLLRFNLDKRGVVSWDTVAAHMDEAGTPAPDEEASTPCGKRGDKRLGVCRAGDRSR